MFDDTGDWCKIWRKIDLSFHMNNEVGKLHEEFVKFLFTGSKIVISF